MLAISNKASSVSSPQYPLSIFLTLYSEDIAKALPRLNDQYVYVDEDEIKEGDRKSYKVRLIGMNIYKQMVIHGWGRGESRVEALTELRTRVEKLGEAKKEDAEAGEEDGARRADSGNCLVAKGG
jgi:hypothetical protein